MLRDWVLGIPYVQYTGYVLVFIAAFLETLPAVGLFIPGQTIILIAGFLSQQGLLNAPMVLCFAILGAIFGDASGYYLGRKHKLLFKEQKGILKEIGELLREHPIKTLVLGRFNSLTRSFSPFAAGANAIRPKTFFIANIIGGMLWGCTWVAIGHVVGASYQLVSHWVNVIALLIIVLLTSAFYLYRFLKKRSLLTQRLVWLLITSAATLSVFLLVVEVLQRGGFLVHLDVIVHQWMPLLWTPLLTVLMMFFTSFVQPLIFAIFTIATSLLIRHHKGKWYAAAFVTIIAGAALLDTAFKRIAMRLRPTDSLIPVDSYSFPSGHALLSTVFFGSLILLYPKDAPRRKTFLAACVTTAFLVTVSRVYLGVHWLSDALAGVLLGVAWLSLCWLVFEGSAMVSAGLKRRKIR